jgi:hypothetical protein
VVYGDAPLRSGDGKGGVHAGALTLKLVRDETNVLRENKNKKKNASCSFE